jgi:hypothetical protein
MKDKQEIAKRLAAPERVRLAELETVVEAGLETFVEVGLALQEIRDARLYREDYGTFETYCKERWGFSRSYGYRLIRAAELAAVSPMGDIRSERQARAILAPTPEREIAPEALEHLERAKEYIRLAEEQITKAAQQRALDGTLVQWPRVRDLLPDITGDQWTGFVESIRTHGLINPIILRGGWGADSDTILDGWMRYLACQAADIEPHFTVSDAANDVEALGRWYSFNLVRAHRAEGEEEHGK